MAWQPAGDTVILEKEKVDSVIDIPDTVDATSDDVFIVKEVGQGYITEQGEVIPPEVMVGDRVIVKGKILSLNIRGEKLLLARAQDVICYERDK